jgi:hypothetical protein
MTLKQTTLVRVGPLIGEDAASHSGDDLVAGKFPLCERAVRMVVIGNTAGSVFHPVFRLKLAKLPFAENMWKLLSAIAHEISHFLILIGYLCCRFGLGIRRLRACILYEFSSAVNPHHTR